jgi:hypothetical protein
MRCSTRLLRELIHRALTPRLTAQLPVDQWYRRSIGLPAARTVLAQSAWRHLRLHWPNYRRETIAKTLAKEYATDPVVTAVMAGALRYVKRKDTNSEIDKKIRRLVARLNQNGRR